MGEDFNKYQLDLLARQPDSIHSSGAFFIGTSGTITPAIIDASAVMRSPQSHQAIIAMKDLFLHHNPYSGNTQVIAGGQSRDWSFSQPLTTVLSNGEHNCHNTITHVMLFNNEHTHPSNALEEKTTVIVSDLNHQGYSVNRKWVPIIRKNGGIVDYAFFYVDRMESDPLQVQHADAVIKMTDSAWNYLHANKKISPEAYRAIMEKRKNPGEWERNMLLSDQGIQRLVFYLENPNSRERGKTLVDRGYPSMRGEILERLPQFLRKQCFPEN